MRWVEEACREAPVIHTISRFTAGEIEAVFGISQARIRVIPPAVSSTLTMPRSIDQAILDLHGLEPGGFALTVSTLEPRKNLKTLLGAYAMLHPADRQRMPLVVAGAKGWGDSPLSKSGRRLLADGSVRFIGYVPDAQLATLYQAARVMLYPSIYEGFGMPVIEALAFGTPVIVSDSASLPEAAGSEGRLVPPLDVDAWCDAVRETLETAETADVAARERRRAHATRWSWTDAAASMVELYSVAAGAPLK